MEHLKKALDYIQANQLEEAIKFLKNAKHLFEGDSMVDFYLAIAFRKNKELDKSISAFDAALKIDSKNADIFSERGVTYIHMEKYDLALSDFKSAKDLEPKNPYRYSSLAFLYGRLRQSELALEYYEKTLELDPSDAVAHNNISVLMEQSGNIKKAQEHAKKADELDSKNFGMGNNKDVSPSQSSVELPKVKIASTEGSNTVNETKEEKVSTAKIIANIFTDKKERKQFFTFIKNGFKLKSTNDK